jgi:hypothetical protein
VNRSIVSSAICVEEDLSATSPQKSASTSIFVSKVMNVRRLLKTAKISIQFSVQTSSPIETNPRTIERAKEAEERGKTGVNMGAETKRTSKGEKGVANRREETIRVWAEMALMMFRRMVNIKTPKRIRRMKMMMSTFRKVMIITMIMTIKIEVEAEAIAEIMKEIREEGNTVNRERATIRMMCTMIKGDKITDSRGKFKINHRNGTNLVNKIILAIRKMKENKSRITKQRKSPKHPKTMNMKNSEGHSNPSGLLGR